ncbi:metallophosphoesterase [Yeguia hominis]|uniref:Metallophosphoesterase n=1 Tax=Yeguia hominis TaxID=2763662 RepID=A0A926D802_9FIRM|nr:metallophosphoesterase [Yeguia hominis]MBC8533034.1 metallophosphoesterase [Yeguia hominis]
MVALLLSPVYILLNVYAVRRILQWVSAFPLSAAAGRWCKGLLIVLYALPAVSPALAYALPASAFQWWVGRISAAWLGCLFYLLLLLAVADGSAWGIRRHFRGRWDAARKNRLLRRGGALCAAALIAVCGYGFWHAQEITVVQRPVSVWKTCPAQKSLRIALISDLHFGYSVGLRQAQRMVDTVNAQNPDLICIAGDVFDNAYSAIEDPARLSEILSGFRSPYGTYACYGNHDVSERLLAGFSFGGAGKVSEQRMDAILTDAGIHLLRDETVLVDGKFYLSGRRDRTKPGVSEERLDAETLLSGVDRNLPVFVLDHQPADLAALAQAGADLVLSGHTHNGQLFPGNLLIQPFCENPYGVLQKGEMTSVVTSGAGVWGPAMRVGTNCEVVVVEVSFLPSGLQATG